MNINDLYTPCLIVDKKKLLNNGDKWESALAENIKADSPFR